MFKQRYFLTAATLGGFLLLADQWLKFFARSNPDAIFYLVDPWFGWEFFQNPGIAFGISVHKPLILLFTVLIIAALIFFFVTSTNKTKLLTYATSLILAGAISNFIDRLTFGITIDYFRIVTSVINLADVVIIIGAILLIISESNQKQKTAT